MKPVPQHGDSVRHLEHLGKAMAHIDHSHAAVAAGQDRAMQRLDLVRP